MSPPTPEKPVTFHFVDVSFNHVDNDDERDFLNSIDTNFDLSDKQVDRLIAAARKVLRESQEFQSFIKLNQEPHPGSAIKGSEYLKCEKAAQRDQDVSSILNP